MKNLIADINLFEGEKLKGFGPLGLEGGEDAPGIFNKFITNTIGVMTVVAFIWFLFLLVSGAISIMTAGGDKQAVQNGAKRITNGLIGLIILISAIFLIQLIGKLLGLEEFILDPAAALKKLTL